MQYIPQAPPFVMVDELVRHDANETVTHFTIPADHLFVTDGRFTEPGLIENMAQTAAAGQGKAAAEQGAAPPVGFIGQIKDLKIYRLPEVGQTITTTIQVESRIMEVSVVKGETTCEGIVLAEGRYSIFLQSKTDSL